MNMNRSKNILSIIKNNVKEEIFKLIHKRSPTQNDNIDDYNIEDKVAQLATIASFKKQVNSLSLDDIDDLLNFYDSDLNTSTNKMIRISLASTLNGKNAMAILENETEETLLMIIMRALRRNSFLERLDTYTKSYDIKKFFKFLQNNDTILEVIKGCQGIYRNIVNDTHKFNQFSRITKVFDIDEDHVQKIKEIYQPFKEQTFKPRLRMLIDTLKAIYKFHKTYYLRQKKYHEEMSEVNNQLGIDDVQEPFDDFIAEYLETPKKQKKRVRDSSRSKSGNNNRKTSSNSISFGIPHI